jgi:hypothetical protein
VLVEHHAHWHRVDEKRRELRAVGMEQIDEIGDVELPVVAALHEIVHVRMA